MNFQELTQRFDNSLAGTDAFKDLYKGAFDLMKSDADNSALYFMLATIARAFVRRYEDQGISGEFVDRAKATVAAFNAKALVALASGPQERLRLLNEIAYDYEWNTPDF